MQKGEVVYCPHYTFPDGGVDDKLIINLNEPASGEPNLFLLTTAQPKTKLKTPGCFSNRGYYVIQKNLDFFLAEFTWVLFWTLTEFSLVEELREAWKGNFKTMGILRPETVAAIINCLRDSNYINTQQVSLLR